MCLVPCCEFLFFAFSPFFYLSAWSSLLSLVLSLLSPLTFIWSFQSFHLPSWSSVHLVLSIFYVRFLCMPNAFNPYYTLHMCLVFLIFLRVFHTHQVLSILFVYPWCSWSSLRVLSMCFVLLILYACSLCALGAIDLLHTFFTHAWCSQSSMCMYGLLSLIFQHWFTRSSPHLLGPLSHVAQHSISFSSLCT